MSKLIRCKVCENEIAKSCKICPSCGAKNRTPLYKKWWILLVFIVFIVALTTDKNGADNNSDTTPVIEENSPQISKNEFDTLQTGMSYEEVVSIIGGEGELLSQVDVAGYNTQVYMWEGEGSIGANANVTFQNDSLTAKAQFGLE